VAHVIDPDECISCGACETECPEDAIGDGEGGYVIDPELCEDCGACAIVCPQECIAGPGDAHASTHADGPGQGHESEYD
jgi:ferredoxin